jgi:hypothetical protein
MLCLFFIAEAYHGPRDFRLIVKAQQLPRCRCVFDTQERDVHQLRHSFDDRAPGVRRFQGFHLLAIQVLESLRRFTHEGRQFFIVSGSGLFIVICLWRLA